MNQPPENTNEPIEQQIPQTPESVAIEIAVAETSETQSLDDPQNELSEDLSLEAKVESIVFASPSPIQAHEVVGVLGPEYNVKQIEHILEQLLETHKLRAGGFALEYIKGHGYQFRTSSLAAPIMERMFASRPRPISRAALETLSIIAYRQPVTRAEIEFIRGVDAGSIIKNLLERNLVGCVGRKEEAGRPMLFGTTHEFLKVFRLNSLDDLPPLQSFQPPREMLEAAMSQLEPPKDIDLEDYVGDEEREGVEFSTGLIEEQSSNSLAVNPAENTEQPASEIGDLQAPAIDESSEQV